MHIEHLHWDSDFFGYGVGKITVADDKDIDTLAINNSMHKLIYLFSKHKLSEDAAAGINAILVDEKLELLNNIAANQIDNCTQVSSITSISPAAIKLALQSGVYSRFYVDTNFRNQEFEKLYTTWITKSLNRDNAVEVFGYLNDGNIVGIITIGIRNNVPDIGLLAVDVEQRGKNIGTILVNKALEYATENGYKKMTVVTQGTNISALNFYVKNGFTVTNKTYIYHIWKP